MSEEENIELEELKKVYEKNRKNIINTNGKITFTEEEHVSVKCLGVYYADLPERGGSAQRGIRPVLVVSSNENNAQNPTVNVIPFTTKMNKRGLPVHVVFKDGYKEIGLKEESTLMCEQLTTIPKENIKQNIGKLTRKTDILKVAKSLRIQIPIIPFIMSFINRGK